MSALNIANPDFIGPDYIRAITLLANGEIKRNAALALANGGAPAQPEIDPAVADFRRYAQRLTGSSLPIELVYVSDNGHTGATEQPVADQAADEIRGRLNTAARSYEILANGRPNLTIRYQDVASQDTLGGAAALRQAVIGELPVFGRFVFLNVAPRKQERGQKTNNGGEEVFVGIHKNGTFFGGTGPHCFSLFKKEVEAGDLVICRAHVAIEGSQFRSRDFFPWLAYVAACNLPAYAHLAGDNLSAEQQKAILNGFNFVNGAQLLHASDIPDVPNNGAVGTSIDVHGNIKTALTGSDLDAAFPNGGRVYILINGKLLEAEVSSASFDKAEGKIALSRGSTYRDPLNLVDNRPAAIEIFKVGARVADDAEVGAPHLRRGLEFHVIDAALLDAAHKRTGSDDRLETAQALVDGGYVKALDNSRLRTALADGRLAIISRDAVAGRDGADHHQHLNA